MATRWMHSAGLLMIVPLLAGACGSTVVERATPPPPAPEELALRLDLAANLEPFDGCEDLLDYFQDQAEEWPEFLPGAAGVAIGGDVVVESDAAAGGGSAGAGVAAEAPAGVAPSRSAPDASALDGFSTTNIQEAGVDEPDVIKTDGRRIVAVVEGSLRVVDPDGPTVRGSLELPDGTHELFLYGDRAIVLTRTWQEISGDDLAAFGAEPGQPVTDVYVPGAPATIVSAVDLSNPDSPAITDSATYEGDLVSARLHDGVVRLVLRSSPILVGDPEAASLAAWLPSRLDDDSPEDLVACDSVTRPPEPSGVGTVTVLTIDAERTMDPVDTDAVIADAQTVYASTETLFVATNEWAEVDDGSAGTSTTEIHAFDIGEPSRTEYLASGRVRGQLLNQWSLSEHEGHLRVATTDGSPWATDLGGEPSSESYLTVLRRDGDSLTTVGQLGGLGRGETIYAVRYFGPVGFVVTFRQTDPLYAIDLSNPASPRLAGELKIPGFSAYLHPVGAGRLLGVGQDATDDGQQLGTQVSLFDVSDLSDLRRLAADSIPDASSAVEYDHRAFLWWGSRDLAVLPVEIYEPVPFVEEPPGAPGVARDLAGFPSSAAAVFRVTDEDVEEVSRVSHEDKVSNPELTYYGSPSIQRAFVIGDRLYTLSSAGVMASDLDTFDERGWAGF